MILDEWKNFSERLGSKVTNDEIRYWASYRGQTLSRTGNPVYHSHLLYYDLRTWLPRLTPVFIVNYLVRGMMYYRKALRLQAFLDRTSDQGVCRNLVLMKFKGGNL
jgi:callose synthase